MEPIFKKIADTIVGKHRSLNQAEMWQLALIVDCCYEVATGEDAFGIIHDSESGESFSNLIDSIRRRIGKRNEMIDEGYKHHPENQKIKMLFEDD